MKTILASLVAAFLALGATSAYAVDQTTSNAGPGASADANGYSAHHPR